MEKSRVITAAVVGGLFAIAGAALQPWIATKLAQAKDKPAQAVRSDRQSRGLPPPKADNRAEPRVETTKTPSPRYKTDASIMAVGSSTQTSPVGAETQQRPYDVDRIALYFQPDGERGAPSKVFIGFRNASDSLIQYRFIHVIVSIDNVPVKLHRDATNWVNLQPAGDLGALFTVDDVGGPIAVGQTITTAYEIEIRSPTRSTIERRYQSVDSDVTTVMPLGVHQREVLSRSTFLNAAAE